MTRISSAIKALNSALMKEEIPTVEELTEISRIVTELIASMVPCDDSSSGEDVSSVECDSDDNEESSDDNEESSDEESSDDESCSSNSCGSERRTYKKGPRSKGYTLYIKNGGTRSSWSDKSDKYKDKYYNRKSV